MPGLMIFRATLRRTGSLLDGHVDHAHATFADFLEQLVRADLGAGAFGDRGNVESGGDGQSNDGSIHETADLGIVPKQSLHGCPQLFVCSTCLFQKCRSLITSQIGSFAEDASQRCLGWCSSSELLSGSRLLISATAGGQIDHNAQRFPKFLYCDDGESSGSLTAACSHARA